MNLRAWLRALPNPAARHEFIQTLDARQKRNLPFCWSLIAREQQLPPLTDWTIWVLLGGRGSGKTRAGAEWTRHMAMGNALYAQRPAGRIALVGETYADVREVMIEGESGLLAIAPDVERPVWTSSRRRLEWPSGAIAQAFSSEDPEALRGPQFDAAWCDELAKWKNPEATWNMLQFGLRLGSYPRQVVTTTPRPTALVKQILKDERTAVSRMKTTENAINLADGFMDRIVAAYAGTRLGRQELDGELIEDRADALWTREMIERTRGTPQELTRILIAVDPPVTGHAASDACGIIVVGMGTDGHAHVLEDCTLHAVSPERWSAAVCAAFNRHQADCVVIETNQGGDMAESVLRNAQDDLPIRQVKARRGKWLRAEPVAHLYERGRVFHARPFPELEDEMCDFGLDGLSNGRSPDRLDALVWGLSELMLEKGASPRARTL